VVAAYGVNARRTKRASLVSLRSRRYLFTKHVGPRWLPLYIIIALLGLAPRLVYYGVQDFLHPVPGDIPLGAWFRGALACILGAPVDSRMLRS